MLFSRLGLRFQHHHRQAAVASLILLLILAWVGGQEGALGLARYIGYAVCHQITVRTYLFGDLVMPLCARCTGQYLGALIGFILLAQSGRWRAAGLPPRRVMVVLALFLALWAFDGLNSYLELLTGQPWLYRPHNLLRLSTGLLQGLAISFLVMPLFNRVFWADPAPTPSLPNLRALLAPMLIAVLVGAAVHSRTALFFYPLALASAATVFFFLSLVSMLFILLLLRRENQQRTLAAFLYLLLPGMAGAGLLMFGIDLARRWAAINLGLGVLGG